MRGEHAVVEKVLVSDISFFKDLTQHILDRIRAEIDEQCDKVLVVGDSAKLYVVGPDLSFNIRLIYFEEYDKTVKRICQQLSQEILEDFSLPGFEIQPVRHCAISPV